MTNFLLELMSEEMPASLIEDSADKIVQSLCNNFKKDKSVISDINGKASVDSFDINEILYFHNLLYEDIQIKKAAIVKNKVLFF